MLTPPEPWPFPTHPGAEGRHVLSALGEAVALAFDRELARLDGADRLAEIRTSARRDVLDDGPVDERTAPGPSHNTPPGPQERTHDARAARITRTRGAAPQRGAQAATEVVKGPRTPPALSAGGERRTPCPGPRPAWGA